MEVGDGAANPAGKPGQVLYGQAVQFCSPCAGRR